MCFIFQPQVRVGQLQVFHLYHQVSGNFSLSQTHCISMPGILDIKWARQTIHEVAVFGLVNARGQLQVWKMGECSARKAAETTEGKVSPESLATVDISDCIGLSLDWDAPKEGYTQHLQNSRLLLYYRGARILMYPSLKIFFCHKVRFLLCRLSKTRS